MFACVNKSKISFIASHSMPLAHIEAYIWKIFTLKLYLNLFKDA